MRVYHPDTAVARYSVPPDIAHDRFQAITKAYDLLRRQNSSSSPETLSGDERWPTAAAWRARQTKTRDLHSEGDTEKWKERLIGGGVLLVCSGPPSTHSIVLNATPGHHCLRRTNILPPPESSPGRPETTTESRSNLYSDLRRREKTWGYRARLVSS